MSRSRSMAWWGGCGERGPVGRPAGLSAWCVWGRWAAVGDGGGRGFAVGGVGGDGAHGGGADRGCVHVGRACRDGGAVAEGSWAVRVSARGAASGLAVVV